MAAIDLIKQYLIGIGFQVNEDSVNKTKKSMDEADKTINNFNKNSQKGFSDTNSSLKDLFQLLMSSSGTLGKLFPELKTPFNSWVKDIALIKKLYNDLTKIKITKLKTETENTDSQNYERTNNQQNKSPIINNGGGLTTTNLTENILKAKEASQSLATEGGGAFRLFGSAALGPIAAITAGVVALVLVTKKLITSLNDLAKQDIEYEKLSRQLWTTKENAKEVDMALKTMGVTMQDLWLSPTLLKQFNQLRKDSKELKLPAEYTNNLKIVQGIGLEFKRLRQLGQLAFQWIGNSILKYAAGPFNDLRQTVRSFNEWLLKNIPNIGKVVGGIIGILIRIIALILKLGGVALKLLSPIFKIIELIGYIGDAFKKLPEPVKEAIKILVAIIIALSSPILTIIALLDDLMTYFKGGKSLTGTFIDKFNKELDSAGKKIKSVIDYFRNLKKEILNSDFVKGAEGILNSVKKGFNDLKKGDFKDLLGDVSVKVNDFSNPNMNKVVSNYATSNISNMNKTSTTTQNSHNTVKNDNKIYVYGGSDANSTGKAVKNNLNGVTLRTVQGGY